MTDAPVSPPEEMGDDEQAAFQKGAAAMARMIGSHSMTVAGALEKEAVGSDDDGDETCPECDADLLEGFGGSRQCPDCEYIEP